MLHWKLSSLKWHAARLLKRLIRMSSELQVVASASVYEQQADLKSFAANA
jgi:hypothetical protein